MIRAWAVWERSKVVGLFLFTEAAVSFAVQLYLIFIYCNSFICEFARLPLRRACALTNIFNHNVVAQGYDLGGCFILSSSNIILLSLGLPLFTQFSTCRLSSSFLASYRPVSIPNLDDPQDLPHR
jgi:hypothetical protein